MCYNGKCFFCIPVENGCLVLAILSAIATGLALLACIILGFLTAVGVIFASSIQDPEDLKDDMDMERERRALSVCGAMLARRFAKCSTEVKAAHQAGMAIASVAGMAAGAIIAIVGVASLMAFIFSVLLCNGICNRRPGQVKSYFIYGVVITVLAVLASILEMTLAYDPAPGIMGLVGSVIYSLFLVMVHQTYTKLCAGAVIKDHVRLVEDYAY